MWHDLAKIKLSRHEEVKEQADWEYFCDLWSSTAFVERLQQNSDSWSKRKWESRNGLKKTPYHHGTQDQDRMLELKSQNTLEDISDKDIMECILGHHFVRLRGWARSLSTSTQTDASESTNRCPSYDELLTELATTRNRLKEVKGGLDECHQVLRGQGFMPAPSNPSHISYQNFGFVSRPHSRFNPSTSYPETNPLFTDANEHDST
ncbi:hypothetical protein TorRG33x02_130410 [Trema orientale]|uniref:Uncharacterized protein n=1 Tax=Trema orientale TaxID=63057 RepID=A0A2P5F0C3_TREOI|nr:hypothetical protein TorRG33x02_130410 [Trema orientale]